MCAGLCDCVRSIWDSSCAAQLVIFHVCSYCFSCRLNPTRLWEYVDSAAALAAILCLNFERFQFPNGRTLYAAHVLSQT